MSLIVYLNGLLVHTDSNTKIAQTKQVNDIGKLSNRQTNYSSISIPRVAKNTKVLQGLGALGVVNILPYQKVVCDVIDGDTGERLIYQGWANITQTSNKYVLNVYDGNIDFFKAIENRMLSELDLASLDHVRNLANVVDSFAGTFDYKYILADFNGQTQFAPDKININYLIPSTKIGFIWDKIFEFTGYTYSGSIFDTPNFRNRSISLPKGQDVGDAITEIFFSDNINDGLELKVNTFTYDNTQLDVSTATQGTKTYFTVLKDGTLNISGTGNFNVFIKALNEPIRAWTWKPKINSLDFDNVTGDRINKTFSSRINVTAGQIFSFEAVIDTIPTGYSLYGIFGDKSFNEIKLERYDVFTIDFFNSFNTFAITDYVNWIMQMYGLTMFKDKYSKHCSFKTLKEITSNTNIDVWSDKFSKIISENYIVGNYTQRSWMRYKYNLKDETYNDSPLAIDNINLKDSSTILQFPIYSPERSKSEALGFITSVYKLWDKSIKDDGTIEYKPLNNRFYVFDEILKTFDSPVTIGSDLEETTITSAPVELFDNLNFSSIIRDNYKEIGFMLNESKLYDVEVFLRQTEVANIDFSKPKFIKQMGGYFLLNKINNFIKNKPTRVELIKINYKQEVVRHYSSDHYSTLHYD